MPGGTITYTATQNHAAALAITPGASKWNGSRCRRVAASVTTVKTRTVTNGTRTRDHHRSRSDSTTSRQPAA